MILSNFGGHVTVIFLFCSITAFVSCSYSSDLSFAIFCALQCSVCKFSNCTLFVHVLLKMCLNLKGNKVVKVTSLIILRSN